MIPLSETLDLLAPELRAAERVDRPAVEAFRKGDLPKSAELFLITERRYESAIKTASKRERGAAAEQKAEALFGLALPQLQQLEITSCLDSLRSALSVLHQHVPEKVWPKGLRATQLLRDFAYRIGGAEVAKVAVDLLVEFESGNRFSANLPADEGPTLHNELGLAFLCLARQERDAAAVRRAIKAFETALGATTKTASKIRYQLNLGEALRLLHERTHDETSIRSAVVILRSVLAALPLSRIPDGPRAREILGLALADFSSVIENEGHTAAAEATRAEAISVLREAATAYRIGSDSDRLVGCLNGLGTIYRDAKRLEDALHTYDEALRQQSREERPLSWSRLLHNRADVLLDLIELNRAEAPRLANEAVTAFEEAAEIRRDRAPLDWARTMVGLAGALLTREAVSIGHQNVPTSRITSPKSMKEAGIGHIQRAIGIYKDTLGKLPKDEAFVIAQNFSLAFELLKNFYENPKSLFIIREYIIDIMMLSATLQDRRIFEYLKRSLNGVFVEMFSLLLRNSIFSDVSKAAHLASDILSALISSGIPRTEWPEILAQVLDQSAFALSQHKGNSAQLPEKAPELYAHRTVSEKLGRKENIGEFMRRVWSRYMDPESGPLTRTKLRQLDDKADAAIEQWLARHNELPAGVYLPTKKVLNDMALGQGVVPLRDAARMAQAERYRRVGKLSK